MPLTQRVESKHKQLWQLEDAIWQNAMIPDKSLPVFVFNIKIQEIHCLVHKITGKIVDGEDDRLMSYDFRCCFIGELREMRIFYQNFKKYFKINIFNF
jgi:hypothetical protein